METSFNRKPNSIIGNHYQNIKICDEFILKLSKDTKNISKEVKNSCKVIHFTSEWNLDEILTTIDKLNPQDFPSLFIFVIELTNFGFLRLHENETTKKNKNSKVYKIKKALKKFSTLRPLLLQLTSVEENVTKFRFKEENSDEFVALNQENEGSNFWGEKKFPSFLFDFLDGKFENYIDFESKLIQMLPEINKTSLLLRFWSTLSLNETTVFTIIQEVTKKGTKNELLTALDAPFENNFGLLRITAEDYFPYILSIDSENEDPENYFSVLLIAVQHQNKEIVDYLITFWTHLIQQLPFEHQVKISTVAFETDQLEILCDLLDIADFPFPKDFQPIDQKRHDKLNKITSERIKFVNAINDKNYEVIDKFIESNPSLRIAYSIFNKSAMQETVDAKQYEVYFYLKSFGFYASEFNSIDEVINADELEAANQSKAHQRRKNINEALTESQKSINLLCNRSFIHNRRVDKVKEIEYRRKIRKWFEDINKIKFGDLFLDVAASCEDLKIIFDFHSKNVENVSMTGAGAYGSMYPLSKWIFVGAMEEDKAREQQIKGVLAHELCHYVMRLVYENDENPYYKIMVTIAERFEEIVNTIDKWSKEGSECPDDECNGIISSLFILYEPEEFHLELIVRVIQILVEFDDDEDKLKILHEKYEILFDFWEHQVIPDLRAFNLKCREAVRKMNRTFGVISFLESELYCFNEPKDIKSLFDSETTIVTSNVPILLLNEVYNYLQTRTGDLFDTENVFVDSELLENEEVFKDFTKLLQEYPKLNVILNCATEIPENSYGFKGLKTIFVVSSEEQFEELSKVYANSNVSVTKIAINYDWNDLTKDSQELLLDHTVNFQDWTEVSLLQLLMPENIFNLPTSNESYKNTKNQILENFSKIVDDELLNLLVNGSEIDINEPIQSKDAKNDNNFETLFIERDFINKSEIMNVTDGDILKMSFSTDTTREVEVLLFPKISQDELLSEVKNKAIVLISDIAGNGKSWVMKNFEDLFKDENSTKWVTYVDLKQFIDEFKAHQGEVEFSSFMTKNILKLQHHFESKVFKELYNFGKVLILFDGFDEIAPDCAEFVSELAKNFQQNGGNQLWIATRDHFEVDLQQKLNVEDVYRCAEFNMGEATTLIAKTWVLMEVNKMIKSVNEFGECLFEPDGDYPDFLQKANKIVQILYFNFFSPVGMPHLMNVIAESYKDDKDGFDTNVALIFDKFMDGQYERWTHEKGQIRLAANTQSQKYELNFRKLHQFIAIENIFPEFLDDLFPDIDRLEWPVDEVIACGLCTKIKSKIDFLHMTYGEFFVAEVVVNGLKKSKVNQKVADLFIKILTNNQHLVIRGFINGLIDDSMMEKIQKVLQNVVNVFDENSNYKFKDFFVEIFVKKLDNFVKMTTKILRNENHKNVRKILLETAGLIVPNLNDSKIFVDFQDLVFDILAPQDLKDLVIKNGIFQCIIKSNLKMDIFEVFLIKLEVKIDRKFIRQGLLLIGEFVQGQDDKGNRKGNIFRHLCQSQNLNLERFQKFLKICQNYLSFNEICDLFKNCNQYGQSVLILCAMNSSTNLVSIWREIENYYKLNDASRQFRDLLKHEDGQGFNVFHCSALISNEKFHKDLWDVLLNTFEDREELKELIIKNDKPNSENFIHKLIHNNSNPSILKQTFDILKENLTSDQFADILQSKAYFGSNLLLIAAFTSKSVEIHKFLWTFFKDFCGSDEKFLKLVTEVDEHGSNILQICVTSSSKDVFEFIIQELESLTTRKEIRKMLSNLNNWNWNLLQKAAVTNTSSELHDIIWKVFRKYFEKSEIINFIKHVDNAGGENLLFFAFIRNSLEMLELIWNEIRKYLSYDEQVAYLKFKNKSDKNILERASIEIGIEYIRSAKIEWMMKLFKDYNIDFTDQQLPQWYLIERQLKDSKGMVHK